MIATRVAVLALAVATVSAAPMTSPNVGSFLPFAAKKATEALFQKAHPSLQRQFGKEDVALPDVDPSNAKCASADYFSSIMGLQTSCAAELPAFSGTVEQLNGVLPTFCGSTCAAEIEKTHTDFGIECFVPGTNFAILFTMLVETCQSYPECFTESYLTERTTLTSTTCSATDMQGVALLIGLSAPDSAAVCDSACVTGMIDHIAKWGKCFQPETRGTFYLLKSLCADNGGTLCADKLKTIGGLMCTTMTTSETCGATGMQCIWTGTECMIKTTSAYLAGVCTTCLDEYVGGMKYVNAAGSAKLASSQRLFCAMEGTDYCFPIANDAALAGALDITKVVDRSTTYATACASTASQRCFRRTGADLMTLATEKAVMTFAKCAKALDGSPKETIKVACGMGLTKQMAATAKFAGVQRLMCVKDDASAWCTTKVAAVLSESACVGSACVGTNPVSSNDCSNYVVAVNDIGCCAAAMDAALRTSPRVIMLAPETDGTDFTPNTTEIAATQPSMNYTSTVWAASQFLCAANFSSSSFAADHMAVCSSQAKSGSAMAKSVTVRLVNYYLANNAGLMAMVKHAVVTDLAVNLGTSQQYIQNVAFSAAADGKHTKISFDLDAPTTTDLAAVAAAFDAATIYWVQTVTASIGTVGLIASMPGSVGGSFSNDLNGVSVLDTSEPFAVLTTTTAAAEGSSSAAVATLMAAVLAVATLAF